MTPTSDSRPSRPANLARLERMTRMMEAQFRIPGTSVRFGWDVVLGLVPGIGDLVSGAVSLVMLREAKRHGVGWAGQARMVGNILIDSLVGSVPVVGDLFDLAFKANQRNLAILRRHVPPSTETDVTPVTSALDPSMDRILARMILTVVIASLAALVILFTRTP